MSLALKSNQILNDEKKYLPKKNPCENFIDRRQKLSEIAKG